jgi:hypothetical protein
MKKIIMMLMMLYVSISVFAQYGDIKPWEKLGITSKEYHEAHLNNFSDDSIKIIVSYGITVSEFFKKPWINLNLTCEQWLDYRKIGMTDNDIYLKLNPVTDTTIKLQSKLSGKETQKVNLVKLQSFFLPGYVQIKKDNKIFGYSMAGLAICGIITTVCWSAHERAPMIIPAVGITLPVMFWSYFNARN